MEILLNLSLTNTSFQNINAFYIIADTSTMNNGILCQSKTSTNL